MAPIGEHIGLWVPIVWSLLPITDFPPRLLCTAWLGVGEVPVIKGSVDKDVLGEAQCHFALCRRMLVMGWGMVGSGTSH